MKLEHTTNTNNYTTHWARVLVPLMLLAAFVLGATPDTALADRVVVINQPDDYVVLDPIADQRRPRRMFVEEPEPSWVVVGTAPPPVRVEVRPPRPFGGAIWVSGYWWWSGVRYVWIGGHYVRPLAGYRFVAPRWVSSGGYYYYVRGHYRPVGASVRHRPYNHYRQVGYYGHRDPRGYRYTTQRSHYHEHGGPYRAQDDKHRGHGKGPSRGRPDAHRGDTGPAHGRGGPHRASPPAHRTAPTPPRANPSRRTQTTPRRTAPARRPSADPRPARSSRVSPVDRSKSSRSSRIVARYGPRRGSGAARTRQ